MTSPQNRSRVVSPSESVRSGTEMQGRLARQESGGSLPLEYLKATEETTDSEQVCRIPLYGSWEYIYIFLCIMMRHYIKSMSIGGCLCS